MADGKPEGISDEEWAAIQAHRKDSAPKRRATLRGTDPESGNEWELELTVEEAARLAGKALGGLFTDEPKKDDGKKDDGKKPTPLKEYFGKQRATG